MVKYMIEDIIPPEKKHHRGGAKKTPTLRGRHVPLARPNPSADGEGGFDRDDRPVHSKVPKKTITEEFPESSPATPEQTHNEEGVVPAMEETEITPHATPVESGTLGISAWGSDFSSTLSPSFSGEETSNRESREHIAPQFPEYERSGVEYDEGGGFRTWLPWLFGVVFLAVLGFFALDFFGGATVTILPKHELASLNHKFTAVKLRDAEEGGKLSYAVMIETASSSLEVPATGEKTVTAKASGRIVVYNAQTVAQRLIKNTRFQAPSGKIYRISDSITIPKGTLANGAVKPGSLEVTVYADEAGPAYNSPPVDFTVPGLKNSTIYEKVYARSKGPIVGGASGTVKTVSDQDLKKAGDDLRIQLETKLRAKSRGNLAGSQIAYDKGIVVALGEPKLLSIAASAENKAVVSAEGTIFAVTFQRADLAAAIVTELIPGGEGEGVEVKNLETLEFSMGEQKGDVLLAGNKLDITLKGTPELSWTIDENTVKTAMLGLPKGRFNEVLSQHASVERAKAAIRPMWKRSFPDNPEKISIVLVNEMPEE
ncbi:MAG: hypothetical protein Q7S52_03730 [bacterium]|nr:hypothetical protein [bacterium]